MQSVLCIDEAFFKEAKYEVQKLSLEGSGSSHGSIHDSDSSRLRRRRKLFHGWQQHIFQNGIFRSGIHRRR